MKTYGYTIVKPEPCDHDHKAARAAHLLSRICYRLDSAIEMVRLTTNDEALLAVLGEIRPMVAEVQRTVLDRLTEYDRANAADDARAHFDLALAQEEEEADRIERSDTMLHEILTDMTDEDVAEY